VRIYDVTNIQTATATCSYTWTEPHPEHQFRFTAEPILPKYELDPQGTPTSIEVNLCIEDLIDPASHCGPLATEGFSMAMSHDPARMSVVDVELIGELLAVGPEYVSFTLENDPANNFMGHVGWSLGVLYTLPNPSGGTGIPLTTVTYQPKKCVARATYETTCSEWADSGTTDVQFEGRWLIDFAESIENLVGVTCGVGYPALVETPSATIEVTKGPADPVFIRGDCSNQGSINISDVIVMLNHVFSGQNLFCKDACDSNDDGNLDIVDAIHLLNYLLTGSSALPAPGSSCGEDPTPDTLSCDKSSCTPVCVFEDCTNGLDDDGDGLIDCADPDCGGTAGCP